MSAEPEAQGAWACASCGTRNEPAAAYCGACERGRPEMVCPACKGRSPAGATACAACSWPFPAERRRAAPGLYMGRDAALHDAAEREMLPPSNLWVLWTAVQAVCALLLIAFAVAWLLVRFRPPGGLGLVLLAVILVVGTRALWRFAHFLGARR